MRKPSDIIPTTIILTSTGTAGYTATYTFTDSSTTYLGIPLHTSFQYVLIDNIGAGIVRVSYNMPSLTISNYVNGAKTLRSGDSFYIEDNIWYIQIYFVSTSTVELVLKSANPY